jgi:hypothetical protein
MNRRFLLIFLLSLSVLTSFPQARASYTLPPENKIQAYVNTLIDSYHTLVQSNFGPYPNSTIKAHFWLWHDAGTTFNVLVTQQGNISGYVALSFSPTSGSSPVIVMDTNDTFSRLYRVFYTCCGKDSTFENINIFLTNRYVTINTAILENNTSIITDDGTNATRMAQQLFKQDNSTIPIPQPPNQGSDLFGWFNDNPVVKALNNLSGLLFVAGVVFTAILVVKRNQVREKLGMGKPPKHSNQSQKQEKEND